MGKPQQESQLKQKQPKQNAQKQMTPAPKKSNLPDPIANPCGIPFKQTKVPEMGELKGL